MPPTNRPLRTHKAQLLAVATAIAEGTDVRDVLAAVTPGGGKSLLPVLAAHALVSVVHKTIVAAGMPVGVGERSSHSDPG